MSKVTLLTSKMQQLEANQRALSILVELDATRILMNCGYGVLQSLLEIGIHHRDIDHIILTHFQPEYVADLLPFLHAGAQARTNPRVHDLHIYGRPGIQHLINTLMDIFELRRFQPASYNIIYHEITETHTTLDTYGKTLFSIPISKNQLLHLSTDEKLCAIIQNVSLEEIQVPLLNHTDLMVINADLSEDNYLVDFAASTQIRHIIYASSYNESNTYMLQKMAEDKGYRGTICIAHNLMSFVL